MTKSYKLHIENFLTVEELDVDLSPGVQGFVGKNAAGKTNILTALQSILSGEHDEKLIKDGAARSEVRLEEIDEGEVVASVSRIQTKKSNRLASNGLPPSTTPKKWLSSLLDEIAINPIRLISEDPVKYLKQHLNIPVTQDEIQVVDGIPIDKGFDLMLNSFDECERVSGEISVSRRAQYQVMRHQQEVVEELRKNLPNMPDKPEYTREQLDDLRATLKAKELTIIEHNKARLELSEGRNRYALNKVEFEEKIITDCKRIEYLEKENASSEQKMKDEIAAIYAKYERERSENEKNKALLIQRIEISKESVAKVNAYVAELDKKLQETPELFMSDIMVEKEKLLNRVADITRYEEIDKRYAQLREKEAEYESAKDMHECLDTSYKYYAYELPKALVNRANLPVKGLEFREQQLYVDDRHIDRLSSAERHLVAVNLAVALAKSKGHIAICLDGIEIMDNEHRDQFLESVKDKGIKVLYTRHGQKSYDHEMEVGR